MTPPPTLLSLPVEVRLLILQPLLVRRQSLQLARWPRYPTQAKHGLQPQILQVCRQLLDEGRVLLYSDNIIQLNPVWGIDYNRSNWVCETCSLDLIGAHNRALITKVEVRSAEPHGKLVLPPARGHHWLFLIHDRFPEFGNIAWFQFTGRESHFRSTLEHFGFASPWRTLEHAHCRARTIADANMIRTVEDETVNQMLLRACGTMEAAGLHFENAYHVRCRTNVVTSNALVNCVVLCKSVAAPASCPGMDRRHSVRYVCMHLC